MQVATSYNNLGSVVRVYGASVLATKSLVRSVHSAQDILQQAEGCHVPATNNSSRKRAGGDSLAPIVNDGIDAFSQSSFESSVKSSKKRKTKKE